MQHGAGVTPAPSVVRVLCLIVLACESLRVLMLYHECWCDMDGANVTLGGAGSAFVTLIGHTKLSFT